MLRYITIGKILKGCKSERIYCGDESIEDKIEFNFSIQKNLILGLDNSFKLDYDEEIFKPNSNILIKMHEFLLPKGIELSPNSIFNGFKLLIDKQDSFSQRFEIVDSEGGSINNFKFQYNGKYYLRMIKEKEQENICVKTLG